MSRYTPQIIRLALALALAFSALSTAHAARDAHPRQVFEVVRFNEDGTEYLLKVTDPNFGTLFRVMKTDDGSVVKSSKPFADDEEDRQLRIMERRHGMTVEPHADAPHPKDELIALLSGQRGGNFYIFVTYGKTIGVYEKVDLLEDEDGNPAKAFGKQIAWHPSGRFAVLVFNQKLEDRTEYEGDFVYGFRFDKGKLPK